MSTAHGPRVAILSAVRTPIGKLGGSLKELSAVTLGTVAVRAALERAALPASEVPLLVMGHGIHAGTGQNPARQVAMGVGVPKMSEEYTVNMVCGSGMQALRTAFHEIRGGEVPLAVAGGMESMSSAPFLTSNRARWGFRLGTQELEDSIMRDSLLDAYGEHEPMGLTGERIARKFNLTRTDVDVFSLRSHREAARAVADGTFDAELVPVPPGLVRGNEGLAKDEGPRGSTTIEGLAKLRPAFRPDGILTAGNSSQIADGAAALVLASESEVERRGAKPLAWIHSTAAGGVDPSDVMEAPIPTVRAHLARVGLTAAEMDRFEHNEAFSSASIAVQRSFDIPDSKFNVHGGAVALGHPIGDSGARIVVTLVHELRRSRGHYGLATLCMGGGNGLSMILESSAA
ncbi:MAG TPA: thiolase family protein [Thermoplasmata archaeon]|nr:thiolase family protein [Thermoplasmata archaeon]